MIIEIVFWISLISLMHTYLFYPFILFILGQRKKQNEIIFSKSDELPVVSIILAVHNEESVIEQKIISTLETDYPVSKVKFYIGSDASTDNTNSIIRKYQNTYPNLYLNEYTERNGKAKTINALTSQADGGIFLLTDANVMFTPNTIYMMVKHFKNSNIGLVAANIINKEYKTDGISLQEKTYMEYEKQIKYKEGLIWGNMIGAFGGSYAIKKEYFIPVPEYYLMDDFYISMNVLKRNRISIMELNAQCYEDTSNLLSEELRRKIRISAGNFQNLSTYKSLLWTPFSSIAFSFFSHKVLRWFGPLFLISMMVSSYILLTNNYFYHITFYTQLLFIITTILDVVISKAGIHLKMFKFVSHFYIMNLALLLGLIYYLIGVKTNVWNPTLRNQ